MSEAPFGGVRVLELADGLAGRACGALLAGLGAEVVRLGSSAQASAAPEPSTVWSDRQKVSAAVDIDGPAGLAELRRLADGADVVVVDDRPGALEHRGLDAVTVRSRNPAGIHVWLPAFGRHGRWSHLAPDALLLSAVSGFAGHHPAYSDRPIAPVVPTVSYLHGALAAAAVASGLVGRQQDGAGRSVAVSGLHAMGAALGTLMAQGLDVDRVISPGRSPRGSPFFRLYQGSDGQWFYLAALSPGLFFRALEAIGRMDVLVRDDVGGEFSALLVPAVREAVNEDLERTFASRSAGEWLEVLRAADVPVAPVWRRDEWMASEVVAANGGRVDIIDEHLGQLTLPGFPVTLSPIGAVGEGTGQPRAASPSGLAPGSPGLPLKGVRVIDLCSFLAGPFASAVLADHGADVVKVEPPDGDPYRVYSVSNTVANQHKRTAALDLRTDAGRQALLRLVADADVVVDNLQPASLARLGLSEDVFAATNPRLVRGSLSAFGASGPWAELPGFDPVLQSLSGLAAAQGGSADPAPSSAPVIDATTGSLAALGILAALHARGAPGRADTTSGWRVRTSLAAAAVFLQSAEVTSYAGRPAPAVGGTDFVGPSAGRRYYAARDGWLAVGATSPDQVVALAAAVGHPEWAGLADDELCARLEARFGEEAVVHWVDVLARRDVPAAQVLERDGAMDDPYLAANGFSHVVADPLLGRFRIVRSYAEWEGAASPVARGSVIGQDTRAVLVEAGLSPDEITTIYEGKGAFGPG